MLQYTILIKIFLLKCLSERCSSAVYIYHHACSVVLLCVPVSLYCNIHSLRKPPPCPKHVEAYDVYSVINSHMFICTYWLYSRHEASVQVMKYLKQLILFYKFYKNYNMYHACVF